MAEVFRGKVAIRGDEMAAYVEDLEQFETDPQPMRQHSEQCAPDFEWILATQYTAKTVHTHMVIIALFVDCVC